MKCITCSNELQAGAKFCQTCGTTASYDEACGHCGERNKAGSRFCAGCGSPIAATQRMGEQRIENGSKGSDIVLRISSNGTTVGSVSSVTIPYGCAAVTLVNGVVEKVEDQVRTGGSNDYFLGANWWKEKTAQFLEFFKAGPKDKVDVYLVNNFKDLSLVTYNHPLPLADWPNAVLRFDLWVEPKKDHLGVFFSRIVMDKERLSAEDLRGIVGQRIRTILASADVSRFQSQVEREALQRQLQDSLGVSSKVLLLKGKNFTRRFTEVGKVAVMNRESNEPNTAGYYRCANCNTAFTERLRFCEECGNKVEHLWKTDSSDLLRAKNGDEVFLRMSYLLVSENLDVSQGAAALGSSMGAEATEQQIASFVVNRIGPSLRKFDLANLTKLETLDELSKQINAAVDQAFRGRLSDFQILDVRTAAEDWIFKTDALINQEIRSIETEQRRLSVDERQLDFKDAEFQIALRRLQQKGRADDLELKQLEAESEKSFRQEGIGLEAGLKREERKIEADNRREDLHFSAELKAQQRRLDQQERFEQLGHEASNRSAERTQVESLRAIEQDAERRLRQRELNSRDDAFRRKEDVLAREENEAKRGEEVKGVLHELDLERKRAGHQADLKSDAQRRDVDDALYSKAVDLEFGSKQREEDLRLKRKEQEDVIDLGINKKEREAGLEQTTLDREFDREMTRQKAEAALERSEKDADSDRSIAELRARAELQDRAKDKDVDVLRAESDLQLKKMMSLADIEARMAAQEFEQEARLKSLDQEQVRYELDLQAQQAAKQLDLDRQKAELEARARSESNQFELEKMATLKGLDPAQLLAMQAAQLANAGGKENVTSVVQAIAQAQVDQRSLEASQQLADEKEKLYRELLDREDRASNRTIEAYRDFNKSTIDFINAKEKRASEDLERAESKAAAARDRSVEIAEKANLVSMENMRDVAKYAAGARDLRQPNNEKKGAPSPIPTTKAGNVSQRQNEGEASKASDKSEQKTSSKLSDDDQPSLGTGGTDENSSRAFSDLGAKSLASDDRLCGSCNQLVGLKKFCPNCGEAQAPV